MTNGTYDEQYSPKEPKTPRLWTIGVLVVLLATLVVFVFLRIRDVEDQMAALGNEVGEARERAAQATQRARDAEAAAAAAGVLVGEAKERADDEATARTIAEEAQLSAESEADFAHQRADLAETAARQARAEADRIRAQRDAEMSRLQDALGRIAETNRTALGLVMSLGEDAINFDFDKADLKPADRELLSRIVGVLMTSSGYRIQVFGHTDDVGTMVYNQTLSERRAQAVFDYLASAGLDPEILAMKGFGKTQPVAEGTGDAARARNRRVELGIIDTVVNYSKEAPPIGQRQD